MTKQTTASTRPRSMAQWAEVVRAAGITDYNEACRWLRVEQGLTSNYAMMAASIATMEGGFRDYGDEEAMIAAMYSGPKGHLLPLFEAVQEAALALGEDVERAVCKTQVSFRSAYQFCIVRPATRSELQVELGLPANTAPAGRLQLDNAKNVDDRVRYKVRISDAKEIDRELKGWLRQAYVLGKVKGGTKK
jgi:predicted transport protein